MLRTAGFGLMDLAAVGLLAAASGNNAAQVVKTRTAGYKAMGAAFKAVNDGLRADPVPIATIRQSAILIRKTSREQYRWFLSGSGPQPGLKTAAKPEIWTNATGFRTAQDAFATQADAFYKAAAGNDVAAIRAASRKLGGACKGCHDSFRTSDD